MVCWQSFEDKETYGDVVDRLHTANAEEILKTRLYLKCIVAVTTFLGKQSIAFRGHNEQDDSRNSGNFLECIKLLIQFDPFLQKYTPQKNTTYLSHPSQNEMITSIAQEITIHVTKQVTSSKMYSAMADEARDGHTQQLRVCVRFVT